MHGDPIIHTVFLIFTGAAILATLALYARQAMIVAYIVLGILIGPFGLGLVQDYRLTEQIAHIGIIFLLFLLGLNLYPQKLIQLVKQTTLVTGVSSLLFAAIGMATSWVLGYRWMEALIVGITLMFSSTIIGLKLLPLTVLHHKHTGEVIISILLLQDLIAIFILLVLETTRQSELPITKLALLMLSLPALILFGWLFSRYVVIRLISYFDKIQEYIFLVAIGWCLGMAELATALGLSQEIGAFIAGVAIATSPICDFIADSLRPLRDFFLVIFFFSLGMSLNPEILMDVLVPALTLALLVLSLKPVIFKLLLERAKETPATAWEIGFRLGQISEFSLLIAVLALERGVIGYQVSYLIEVSTLLTFILSSYIIVFYFPTPIALSDRLRRD
jgi:Kef-type K+ transport system membrane component KefB